MSFSAEMKGFLDAYKTGQAVNASRTDQDYKTALTDSTTKKTARDNDPDSLELEDQTARAKLAQLKDSLVTSAAHRGNIAAQTAYYKALAAGGGDGSGLAPPGAITTTPTPGVTQPTPQGQGALPLPPPSLDDGRATAYADGGLVPDDDEASETTPDDEGAEQGALPIGTPADAPTDVSARSRGGIAGVVSPQLLADANKAGLNYNARMYGLSSGRGAVRMPGQAAMARAYLQGHGGLSDQEMAAIKKTIDPDGTKYTESQRNAAALGSVYQYWNNKGEPEKAQRVAGQMLQYYRNASQRYAAIAAHAAQGGDLPLAAQALVRSYQLIPDGHDLHVVPAPDGTLRYSVTGPDGNTVTKGIATPQQMYSSAMGLASGGFDKAILHAAGVQEEAVKGKGGEKAPTMKDRKTLGEMVDDPEGPFKTAMAADAADKVKAGTPQDTNYWADLRDTTAHMLQQNPDAQPHEAFEAAKQLLHVDPDSKNPTSLGKVAVDEDTGDHTITLKNGLKAKLNPDRFEALMNKRAAALKASDDSIDAEVDAEDAPSWWQKRVAPVGAAVSAAVNAPANYDRPQPTPIGVSPWQQSNFAPPVQQTGGDVGPLDVGPLDKAPAVPVNR